MSKDKVQTTVKDDLNVRLYGCIKNIENTIKHTGNGNLQDILSAILNQSHFSSEYKPFKRDIIDINTLLTSDPITVISYIKDRDFEVFEIKEFQKEGRELISKLASPTQDEEQDLLKKNNMVVSTPSSTTGSTPKTFGPYTENLAQQKPEPHKGQSI